MEHLDFLVWMLGYSIVSDIGKAINWQFCERREYSADTRGWAAVIEAVVYFGVAGALW